jgi:hypothetical protein
MFDDSGDPADYAPTARWRDGQVRKRNVCLTIWFEVFGLCRSSESPMRVSRLSVGYLAERAP